MNEKNVLYRDKLIREKINTLAFLLVSIAFASLGLFLSIGWFLVYGITDPLFWFFSLSTMIFIVLIPFFTYYLFKVRFEVYDNGVIVTKSMITYFRLLFKEKKDGIFIPFDKMSSYDISKSKSYISIFVNGDNWDILFINAKKAYSILDRAYKDYMKRKALVE